MTVPKPLMPPPSLSGAREVGETRPDVEIRKYWRDKRTFYLVKGILPPELRDELTVLMEALRVSQEAQTPKAESAS